MPTAIPRPILEPESESLLDTAHNTTTVQTHITPQLTALSDNHQTGGLTEFHCHRDIPLKIDMLNCLIIWWNNIRYMELNNIIPSSLDVSAEKMKGIKWENNIKSQIICNCHFWSIKNYNAKRSSIWVTLSMKTASIVCSAPIKQSRCGLHRKCNLIVPIWWCNLQKCSCYHS